MTRAVPRLEPSSHLSEQQQMPTQAAPMRTPRAILLCRMGPFQVASRVRQTVYQAVEQATKKSDPLRSCSRCVPICLAEVLKAYRGNFVSLESHGHGHDEQMWLA
jgi:hypothetical protein